MSLFKSRSPVNQPVWGGWYERQFLKHLQGLDHARLRVVTPKQRLEFGLPDSDLDVELVVHDPAFFSAVILGGSVGAAESYMAGEWQCDALTQLVQILVRNRALSDGLETRWARLSGAVLKLLHWWNRNTELGSRRNIAAHYDLGNALFEKFLDREWMMYSSAWFETGQESLEAAQTKKLQRLCDKLNLQPHDHLIEIGTGWGGAALFAAIHYGCRVTTTTISQEQFAYATARVQAAGLSDKITVLFQDYRQLEGQYDKLISIEMIEAVGHHFLDQYFAKCAQLLKPDGLAVIQAITIEDHRYQQSLKTVDFIKRYIFPGSFIPSVSAIVQSAGKATLRLTNLEDIGPSYATTLQIWRERFMAELPAIRAMGYPDEFIRMWEFYLCYCEGGFLERSIADVHLLFSKPQNRLPHWMP